MAFSRASRIKDKFHRPCFVFAASNAPGKEHELKGSGRSIPGFHLRDALDLMAKKHPHILLRFGGHAMAAGCTIEEEHLELFESCFMDVAAGLMSPATLQRKLETVGGMPVGSHLLSIIFAIFGRCFAIFFDEPVE